MLLDSKRLTEIEETEDSLHPFRAEPFWAGCTQRPRLTKDENQNWFSASATDLLLNIRLERDINVRCKKTAETCICVGLKTYSMVMTLERAVKMVPRTSERNVRAGSPSSRSDTTNRDTSMPALGRQSVLKASR